MVMPDIGRAVFALATAGGSLIVATATFVAQSITADPSSIGTATGFGSTAVAVAAIAYVVRLMASGKLVYRDTADVQAKADAAIANLTKLTESYEQVITDARQREDRLWNWVQANPTTRGGSQRRETT
jgi:low affinity Fe/Cu permease